MQSGADLRCEAMIQSEVGSGFSAVGKIGIQHSHQIASDISTPEKRMKWETHKRNHVQGKANIQTVKQKNKNRALKWTKTQRLHHQLKVGAEPGNAETLRSSIEKLKWGRKMSHGSDSRRKCTNHDQCITHMDEAPNLVWLNSDLIHFI